MRTSIYSKDLNYQSYIKSDIKYDLNYQFHCEDGPAVIEPNGDKFWFIHGKLHRLDGPASEFADGGKEWFLDDKLISVSSQEEFERLLKLRLFW